jgi:hypothetical protein
MVSPPNSFGVNRYCTDETEGIKKKFSGWGKLLAVKKAECE